MINQITEKFLWLIRDIPFAFVGSDYGCTGIPVRPDFKKVPVPAGIIIGSGRNKILLKTALFPNCFKLFHKLIQLTKTISDYGEEIKVFRHFLEEVCSFFLHICFRIRRTAFLNKLMTEVMIQSNKPGPAQVGAISKAQK